MVKVNIITHEASSCLRQSLCQVWRWWLQQFPRNRLRGAHKHTRTHTHTFSVIFRTVCKVNDSAAQKRLLWSTDFTGQTTIASRIMQLTVTRQLRAAHRQTSSFCWSLPRQLIPSCPPLSFVSGSRKPISLDNGGPVEHILGFSKSFTPARSFKFKPHGG